MTDRQKRIFALLIRAELRRTSEDWMNDPTDAEIAEMWDELNDLEKEKS